MWALRLHRRPRPRSRSSSRPLASYQHRNISRLSLFTAFLATVGRRACWPRCPTCSTRSSTPSTSQPGNNRRLVGVLLGAVVVLFLMLFRLQGHSDRSERAIRQLVEALAVERFDWDEAAAPRARRGPRSSRSPRPSTRPRTSAPVIEAMPKEVAGYHVVPIVVDDHSDDGTADAARVAGALAATPADPPRRRPGAPRRLRHRVAARRRHRRDARRRRPAPARGDPHPDRADHRGPRRPRERLAHAGRLRAGGAVPPPCRRALLLVARDDPHRSAHHRHLQRLPRHAGRDPAQADPGAGPVLDLGGHDRGACGSTRASSRCR